METSTAAHAKKGKHMMIEDAPCKIMEVNIAVNGKHGAAKAMIIGLDVFTGQKRQFVAPGDSMIHTFKPKRNQYQVLDLRDSYCEVLNNDNQMLTLLIPDNAMYQCMAAAISKGQELNLLTLTCPNVSGGHTEKVIGFARIH